MLIGIPSLRCVSFMQLVIEVQIGCSLVVLKYKGQVLIFLGVVDSGEYNGYS